MRKAPILPLINRSSVCNSILSNPSIAESTHSTRLLLRSHLGSAAGIPTRGFRGRRISEVVLRGDISMSIVSPGEEED
ncbi:hypothetical protein AAHA92_11279 [Salvia divinorum]|uniref:Uncharacterized protein n=1 Tax=Salvia divinorum TaxID=28513 RepID=A0ABD1HGH1_SALDI